MSNPISNLYNKLKLLSITAFNHKSSHLIMENGVQVTIKKGARLTINKGVLKIGGAFPNLVCMPSYPNTVLCLEQNSELIINGDVFITQGCYLNIKKNGKTVFEGGNFIGHNSKIISSKKISFGKNSSTSWNVTLIDDDGHDLFRQNGSVIKRRYPELNIEDNVGIQMNVTIPRGIRIGSRSLIGANTTLRKNVSNDQLIYSTHEQKEKHGVSAGLQFIN